MSESPRTTKEQKEDEEVCVIIRTTGDSVIMHGAAWLAEATNFGVPYLPYLSFVANFVLISLAKCSLSLFTYCLSSYLDEKVACGGVASVRHHADVTPLGFIAQNLSVAREDGVALYNRVKQFPPILSSVSKGDTDIVYNNSRLHFSLYCLRYCGPIL